MPLALPGRDLMRVTRLENVRSQTGGDGVPPAAYHVMYYWFVGHDDVTGSHFARTWLDVRDRLLHGYNQRWAYITVSSQLPVGAEKDPRLERVVDDWTQGFIKQLLPKIQKAGGPTGA